MDFSNCDEYFSIPSSSNKVYKDECAFSLASPESDGGIFVCLKSFVSVGPQLIAEFVKVTGNCLFLRYEIIKTPKPKDEMIDKPASHPTKLGIGVEGGFDLPHNLYSLTERWTLIRFPGPKILNLPSPLKNTDVSEISDSHLSTVVGLSNRLRACIASVQCCDSAIIAAERAGAVAVWEAENLCPVSKHAESLVQLDNGVKIPPTGLKCAKCDLTTNLWLNLSDGFISCGRKFWDGTGGRNHAIEHYNETGFPLAVKLGTITPASAEVYSYAEDDMVTDPLLAKHLTHFGINAMVMEKTDKTMLELEIAANERFGEWLTLQEADKTLEPLYGPGLTGIFNLGNTCYINSTLQILFSVPQFRWRYAFALDQLSRQAMLDLKSSFALPVDNFGLQFAKIGHSLCSGSYSFPPPCLDKELTTFPPSPGIRPRMFRHIIGRNHTEFASKRQQDVAEFLIHLFSLIETDSSGKPSLEIPVDLKNNRHSAECPLKALTFAIEDRLQCGATGKVQYSERKESVLSLPIPLSAASNVSEVAAYEERRKMVETTGEVFKEPPVYLDISLEDCLRNWSSPETIADFRSPATNPPNQPTTALRSSRLATFPDLLCVQMLKFTMDSSWTPCKMNVAIRLDDKHGDECGRPSRNWLLNLGLLRPIGGLQPGEEAMPNSRPEVIMEKAVPSPKLIADETVMAQLTEMGFSPNACHRACVSTTNSGIDAAMGWMMEHMDDPNLNNPIPEASTALSSQFASIGAIVNSDVGALATLMEMGFSQKQASRALELCDNNLELAANLAFTEPHRLDEVPVLQMESVKAALSTTLANGEPLYELIGFISHMGNSTAAGHYVCHIKRSALATGIPGVVPACEPSPPLSTNDGDEWVIFNDEKVARSQSPPFQHAYLYFFRRLDAS